MPIKFFKLFLILILTFLAFDVHAKSKKTSPKRSIYSLSKDNYEMGIKGSVTVNLRNKVKNDELYNKEKCFKAQSAKSKYILGNACENELVIGAYSRYRPRGDLGPYIHGQVDLKFSSYIQKMVKYRYVNSAYIEIGELNTHFGENNVWFGKKDYSEHYIDIIDLSLIDIGGDGIGIGGIDLGLGKLAYAHIKSDPAYIADNLKRLKRAQQLNHDIRFSNIDFNKNGKLSLWFNYASAKMTEIHRYPQKQGFAFGVFHDQKNFLKADNKISFQYGTNLMSDFKGRNFLNSFQEANSLYKAHIFRFTNSNIIKFSEDLALSTVLLVEQTKSKNKDGKNIVWKSIGARPLYFLDDNWRLAFEVGYDLVKNKINNHNNYLRKYTFAVEYALKKEFKAKPLIRAYVTSAKWKKDAAKKKTEKISKKNSVTFGIELIHEF